MTTSVIASEIVSILFLAVIVWGMLKQRESIGRLAELFLYCVGSIIAGNLMDCLSYLLDGLAADWLLFVITLLAYLFVDAALVCFVRYCWAIITDNIKDPRSVRLSIWPVHLAYAVCTLSALVMVITACTGHFFTVKSGTFVSGPLCDFAGLPEVLLTFILAIYAFIHRRAIGVNVMVANTVNFLLPVLAAAFAAASGASEVTFVYTAMSLVMAIVYISLQSGEIDKGRMREKLMYEMSYTDPLTQLSNRRAYTSKLVDMTPGATVGVLFCDLNGLKAVNDTQGHSAGDDLIREFAELLKLNYAPGEAFRISGDEFVVLKENMNEELFTAQAKRIRRQVQEEGEKASIGYAYGPSSEVFSLVHRAEDFMYREKKEYYERRGSDRYQFVKD